MTNEERKQLMRLAHQYAAFAQDDSFSPDLRKFFRYESEQHLKVVSDSASFVASRKTVSVLAGKSRSVRR